ncbi:MAG: GNAT family N-acetyltransferase [Pseudomonadota bacterium]
MSGVFDVRAARRDEAAALANLHVEVWRETYADLAPAEAYRALDVTKRLPYWETALASADPLTGALVATDGASHAAVLSYGHPTEPQMTGAVEIKHCYVHRQFRGHGLGRRMLEVAFAHLRSNGATQAALAVVQENDAARRFYKSMGGQETGRFTDPGPLWRSTNCLVTWWL